MYSTDTPAFEQVHLCANPAEAVPLTPLVVNSTGGDYLLMLSVTESWVTDTDIGAIFCIDVDGQAVDCSWASSAFAGQRVPHTVLSVQNLPAGTHTIGARWFCSHGSAQIHLGTNNPMWLVAMRADDVQSTARPTGGTNFTHNSQTWQELDLPSLPLTINSTGSDYLFALRTCARINLPARS